MFVRKYGKFRLALSLFGVGDQSIIYQYRLAMTNHDKNVKKGLNIRPFKYLKERKMKNS